MFLKMPFERKVSIKQNSMKLFYKNIVCVLHIVWIGFPPYRLHNTRFLEIRIFSKEKIMVNLYLLKPNIFYFLLFLQKIIEQKSCTFLKFAPQWREKALKCACWYFLDTLCNINLIIKCMYITFTTLGKMANKSFILFGNSDF